MHVNYGEDEFNSSNFNSNSDYDQSNMTHSNVDSFRGGKLNQNND